MSEHERNEEFVEQPDHAAAPEPTDDHDTDTRADTDSVVTALEKERDDLNDRLLRTMADYQNFARRAEQNVAVARDQQSMDIAKQLVTVLDHFDRALEIDPEKTTTQDLLQGVVIVRDELLRTLHRFGIERVEVAPGDVFDPNRHEALMRQPSEEVETNHVTAQFQPGYMLRDKIVRPAKVAVAE